MKSFRALQLLLTFVAVSADGRPPPAGRWCTGPAARTAASRVVAPCVRKIVAFNDLPKELARIEATCRGISACAQTLQGIVVKDIAGPWIGDLWYGQTNASFAPLEQDGFIADARGRAVAAQPASTDLVGIEYLFYYPLCGGGTALLGARATYAGCGPASFTE